MRGFARHESILEHYYDVRFHGEFVKLLDQTDVGRNVEVMAVEACCNRGCNWFGVKI